MCHSLFNYLYETRLLFLEALSDEFVATAGRESLVYLNPITINDLFHQCMSNHQSFQEFGSQCAKAYTQTLTSSFNEAV
jgi:hypothetical protein